MSDSRTGVNGIVQIDPNEVLRIERDEGVVTGASVLLWPGRWRIALRESGGGGGSGGPVAWDDVINKPTSFPPEVEATQDIVGAMVAGAGGTYDDAAGSITLPSGGGGGDVYIPTSTGKLTGGWAMNGSRVSLGINAGQMLAFPLAIESARTIGSVELNVGTASAAGVARLGIYTMGDVGSPSPLLADFGTVPTATAGNKTITGLSVAAPAGVYWVVAHADEAFTFGNCVSGQFVYSGVSVISVSANPFMYRLEGTPPFGPLPAFLPALDVRGGREVVNAILPIFLGDSF